MRDDANTILSQILSSDVVVLAGRISFGGYSAVLKRIVDRILPVLLPFFRKTYGDTHHPARYSRMPRLVAVGVSSDGNSDVRQSELFRALVARNAINLHAPSYAAEILHDDGTVDESADQLRKTLERTDPLPSIHALTALAPAPHACAPFGDERTRRVLSIIGSPKRGPSNSLALATYLEGRMRKLGWEAERCVLKGNLRTREGRADLVAAVERAELVCLAAPLYVDSLHYLVTLALEVLAAERARWSSSAPKRLVSIVNSGFPEAHQNVLALAICEQFAQRSGWTWAGGLALGGGEALAAMPLDAPGKGRPPTHHLRAALDATADALHWGAAIPDRAQSLFDRSPIPGVPRWLWRMLFRRLGASGWRQQARGHGIDPHTLGVRPLAC
jgi:hypothetical protein